MIRFGWRRVRTHERVAVVQVKHEVTASIIAGILVHNYSAAVALECGDELPVLTRAQVEREVRERLLRSGDVWMEGGFWKNTDSAEEADVFNAWALATVKRCFPELAEDKSLNSTFGTEEK